MKNYVNVKFVLSTLAMLSMSSCCSLCLKSISVEPVWKPSAGTTGGTVTASNSDLSAKGTLTFTECADPAKCEAIRALNKQMKLVNQDYKNGKITWAQYSERSDHYLAQLKSYSEQDKKVAKADIIVPSKKDEEKTFGAAPGTRFIKRKDFATEDEYQKAAVAELRKTTLELRAPASTR